jgi:hypothetical protein
MLTLERSLSEDRLTLREVLMAKKIKVRGQSGPQGTTRLTQKNLSELPRYGCSVVPSSRPEHTPDDYILKNKKLKP